MAIAAPSSASYFCCIQSESTRRTRFTQCLQFPQIQTRFPTRRFKLTSQLNKFSTNNSDEEYYELLHGLPTTDNRRSRSRSRGGTPVFVTLPTDAVSSSVQMTRKKAMAQSFRALAAASVEGVVMEVWWGFVERDTPGVYNWGGYLDIVNLAAQCGLKVRAVLGFHQNGSSPDDPSWIPLPRWVREAMYKDQDIAFSDRFGRKNMEYISLGCDTIPVLRGRSPIQAYSDFMISFRDTFKPFLGDVITGIQVGMGPAGELRYPSCPFRKLALGWHPRELGEFQCYDKYMIASLNACAQETGVIGWANGGPLGANSLTHDPERTDFFRIQGAWNTPYGEFFLKWYSKMLLLHGERICREVNTIFRKIDINISAKVAGIHWHYGTQSHPSELTAGYYNTSFRDGYMPIARMLGRYRFSMCSTCFDMQDVDEKKMNPNSSPEGVLKQLLIAAKICNIPLTGENWGTNLDDGSLELVLKRSKSYSDGPNTPGFSFNFVRMDRNMFEFKNWIRFTHFVRHMSDSNNFRSKLDSGGGDVSRSSSPSAVLSGALFAY